MSWSLVKEYGLRNAREPSAPVEALSFPVVLERDADGSYLIVDEIGLRKNLTTLTECRTLRVGGEGEVRFDSLALGMSDAFGCLAGERIALLRRTRWELELRSVDGALEKRVDLARHTKRMPRLLSYTPRGTFLISAIDTLYDNDILELDDDGNLLWHLPKRDAIGCPTSLQLLDDGGVLLADEFGHIAVELRRDGSRSWQYGRERHPARASGCLSNPMAAFESPGGERLIADTRNHRILRVENESARPLELGVGLCGPAGVRSTADGHILVCDAGNERVMDLEPSGRVVWQYGSAVAESRSFSFPRSLERDASGTILLADTGNDGLKTLGPCGTIEEETLDIELFWPRCARKTPRDHLVVADARHSRIVELAADGSLRRELHRLRGLDRDALDDPHEVRLLPNGRLLIADAGQHLVVETDWEGNVSWAAEASADLKDPHSAQSLPDGTVLVSDTGRGRLVWLDRKGRVVREVESFPCGRFESRLSSPRYAELSSDGTLLVVDSGNDRILAVGANGALAWSLTRIPDSAVDRLGQPRWAQLIGPQEVIVSDFFHHRVLHLRLESERR